MIRIRLKKHGRKRQPSYRIVAMHSTVKRDGRVIEELGFYDPMTKEIRLKVSRILFRLKTGAQPSKTVKDILIKTENSRFHFESIINKKKTNKKI